MQLVQLVRLLIKGNQILHLGIVDVSNITSKILIPSNVKNATTPVQPVHRVMYVLIAIVLILGSLTNLHNCANVWILPLMMELMNCVKHACMIA